VSVVRLHGFPLYFRLPPAEPQGDARARLDRLSGENAAPRIGTLTIEPEIEARQIERLQRVRAARDQSAWRASLDAVSSAARGTDNLVPPIVRAVEAHATVGEISDAMRAVFGEHKEINA
jgi:methylmalonyl-CoA mutase N-terminal domain/subunit